MNSNETVRKVIQVAVKADFFALVKEHCRRLDMPITVWSRELLKRELDADCPPQSPPNNS